MKKIINARKKNIKSLWQKSIEDRLDVLEKGIGKPKLNQAKEVLKKLGKEFEPGEMYYQSRLKGISLQTFRKALKEMGYTYIKSGHVYRKKFK